MNMTAITGKKSLFGFQAWVRGACLALFVLCAGGARAEEVDPLSLRMIATFDDGIQNLLGGYYNKFESPPSSASTFLSTDVFRGAGGAALRVEARQRAGGFCGVWMHFFDFRAEEKQFLDTRNYAFLSFWVRGQEGGERFTVKMADDWEGGGAHVWAPPPGAALRALEMVSRLVAKEVILDPVASSSQSAPAGSGPLGLGEDVLALVAVDRLCRRGTFWGLIKGFGLAQGACGSTMCWDTADLLAVGCDPESLRTVVHRLRETGGGVVYAVGGQVVAELVTPVCGLVSRGSMEDVAQATEEVERALAAAGVAWEKPLLTLSTLATAAIPFFRVTHRGYLRMTDRALLPLQVS